MIPIPTYTLYATLLAAFLLFFPSRAEAAPGDLDSLNVNVVRSDGVAAVYATAVQPDGKIILVGRFSSVLGVPRNSVARLNVDGTLDASFDPNVGAGAEVHTVVVQADGKILLGGGIQSLRPNGAAVATPRSGIARVNADGSLDVGFDPNPNSHVESIALQADGKILIGGSFTTLRPSGAVSGTFRVGIARVNADGSLDSGFTTSVNSIVNCVAVQTDGKILLGGSFTTVQAGVAASVVANNGAISSPRNRIARINADGTLDVGFNPNANGSVECMTVQADGKILLAGNFTTLQPNGAASPTARIVFARVNLDGTLDDGFVPPGNDDIYSLTLQADGKILVGDSMQKHIQRLGSDGSLDTGFKPAPNGIVRSVAVQSDGKVLVSGSFTTLNGSTRNGFARLLNDPATQSLSMPSATRVLWTRGGSAPELSSVTMEKSTDGGSSWMPLGDAVRVGTSSNWQLAGLSLPSTGHLRARGRTMGGFHGTSSGVIEQVLAITLDTATLPPTLTAPAANAIAQNPMTVSFSLPEAALPGSVTLSFTGMTTTVLTLADSEETSGAHSFSFSPANPRASAQVDSGAAFADGIYTVTLSYRDARENLPATVTRTGVTIDTTAPQISVPVATRQAYEGLLADYTSLAVASDAHLRTVTQSPSIGSVTTAGLRTITLTATDAAGNASSAMFDLEILAVHDMRFATGDSAPGAGTNGIPANAKIVSFNTPATDDAGNVAFLAKWTAGPKSRGTQLFLNNTSPTILNLAAYKSFTDPVVDGGIVATIAGLNPSGSVVLSGSAALGVIARSSDRAPGAGGAAFKKFKAVAVHSGNLAIFAQLDAPAASDLGLWIKDGAGPLKLALREGQIIDGKTIKTLVAFMPGKDSPGCGRGWLTSPGSGVVLALVFFTDKTQAVVLSDANGATTIRTSNDRPPTIFDDSLAGASFASYGIPAASESTGTAFLATLKVGAGGVTKADARGIFLGDDEAQYTPIARIGKPSTVNGADFSSLGDPMLSANGSIAFSATLEDSTANTIWWKPTDQPLGLLAQTGTAAGDIADSRWKSFDSLAITDQGPIFAATLALKKGGVTAKTAKGVWVCDTLGAPRLLFRTGDTIKGKKLAAFTLLKVTVGNAGVTRCFNNSAAVVWLATFTDKTSAIIRSKLP